VPAAREGIEQAMAKKKPKPRPGGQGRPKGMRVVFCKQCGRRVTGFPRKRIPCKSCGTVNTIPMKKAS
jgi:ribosomal protein S27E